MEDAVGLSGFGAPGTVRSYSGQFFNDSMHGEVLVLSALFRFDR